MEKVDLDYLITKDKSGDDAVLYRFLFSQMCPNCSRPIAYLVSSNENLGYWKKGLEEGAMLLVMPGQYLKLKPIANVPWGKKLQIAGELKASLDNESGVSGKEITFDGTGIDPGLKITTEADGSFKLETSARQSVGKNWTVKAKIADANQGFPSYSPSQSYSTIKHKTALKLSVTPIKVSKSMKEFEVSGELVDEDDNKKLESKRVEIIADTDGITFPAIYTDSNGSYKVNVDITNAPPKDYKITARFGAGDLADEYYADCESNKETLTIIP